MTSEADAEAAHRAIEAVWRIESARIIAGLAGLVRDVGLAEELAQDALVAALEQWPAEGIPPNPGAWLMVTAKHRAIDRIRRNERLGDKLSLLGRELETEQQSVPKEFDDVADNDEKMGDDLLRLMFISCHPVLSTEARIALTLRLLGGLTTEEIAHAGSWRRSRRSRSASCGPSGRWPVSRSRSRFRRLPSARPGWHPCSRCSTWCSTRATRRWPGTTGCGPRCAPKRSGLAGCWPS